MAFYPTLQILEGENLSLSLQGDDDNQFLFGDESGSNLYQLSKSLDHIRKNYYSPLYKQYVPVNAGLVNASHTLEGDDGNFYHFDAQENFLGCSLCSIASTLAGDEIREFHHFNADGTLAGVTVTDENGKEFLYEGAYELSGFSFGKMKFGSLKLPKMKLNIPKMKFNVPKIKIPQMPKINIPKLPAFKMPNIKMPNFKMPKLPDVGKQLSKGWQGLEKGMSKGWQSFERLNKDLAENLITKPFEAIGDLATGLLDTAGSLLTPGGEQMPQEGQEEGSGELTPQDPGYTDENGYTASDGVYYSHDNLSYFDFQRNEWIPLNPEADQGSDFSQVGYTDENGFRADDGLFYSHDGQYILNEQTNEWIPT